MDRDNLKTTSSRLIPITEWASYHAWPPIGGLRHLVFNANQNGFKSCIVRIGRRVLVDEARFFIWADKHREVSQGDSK